jgi:hypothetical protein
MWGKHFSSMYEGSLVGSGAIIFAVWGYVIANFIPDKKVGAQVRLNPVVLAAILGEKEGDVTKAIQFLCAPDKHSTTKDQQGKRLIQLSEFDYQVVNGAKYRAIRNEEERREQNRAAQARYRARLPKPGIPHPGENENVRMLEAGASQEELDRHQESHLPS